MKMCEGCSHPKPYQDGYCYMFRTKPEGTFCGQNTVNQEAYKKLPKSVKQALFFAAVLGAIK